MLAGEERVDRATIASLIISSVENVSQDRDYIDAYDIFYGSFYQDLGLSCPENVNCDLYRIDEDNDGLPDYWEIFYFGSIDVENGNDDTDGDGQTNLEEYIANLDPCLLGCYVGIPDGDILPASMPAPLDDAILLASDQTQVIAGTFRVNESGAATYSMPISLPSGTAGVTPSLSLEYTSQNGNGLMGQGWSLGGISSIARCRKTLGHDGIAKPITWTVDDRFCLDGQRLVMVKGTGTGLYGGNGVSYRTEVESDIKVTSFGGTIGNPKYFMAESKDGSLKYFGETERSTQYTSDKKYIISWALERSKDSVGNEVKYNYETNDGVRLTRIDYGFGSNSTAASSVILKYSNDRPDPRSSYIGGYLVRSDHRLTDIEVQNDGLELRTYKLEYLDTEADLVQLSRVSKVHETRNNVVMSTTNFDWGMFDGRFQSKPYDTVLLNDWDKKYIPSNQPADINGDGRLDFIWQEVKPDSDGDVDDQYFNYILATENGFTELQGNIRRGESTQNSWPMQTIDYNADGRSDLAYYQRARDGRWWIHISHPTATNWRIDGSSYVVETDINQLDARFVDINSDGLTDVIFPEGYRLLEPNPAKNISDVDYYHYGPVHPISIQGLEGWIDDGSIPYSYFTYFAPGGTGDFNGDGNIDFILMDVRINFPSDRQVSRFYLAHLEDDQLILSEKLGEFEDTDVSGGDVDIRHLDIRTSFRTGDFNGDGLTDLLMQENGSARDVYSYRYLINQGAMVNGSHFIGWNNDSYNIGEISERSNLQLVDYDLDGALDLIWADYDNYDLLLRRWVGDVLQPAKEIRFILNDKNQQHLIFDMSGDGRPDYVNIDGKDLSVYLSRGDGEPLNVISKITNGWGAETDISYETLSDSDHYARYDVPTVEVESCHVETEFGYYFGQSFCANVKMADTAAYYSVLNGDWSFSDWPKELPSQAPVQTLGKYRPVMELIGPMQVVTRVNSSAPSGDESVPGVVDPDAKSSVSYYYTQAQIQAAGRGILGFQRLTSVDEQTGVITETRYRQDFPFTGSPLYTSRMSKEGNLLSVSGNEWRVKGWSSNWPSLAIAEGQGTVSLGSLRPYISKSYDLNYDLESNGVSQGSLLATVTTEYGAPDEYGNVDFTKTTTEANGELFEQTTQSEYGPGIISFSDTDRTLTTYAELGRLTRTVVTHSRSGSPEVNRTSAFEYYENGPMAGLTKKEIIEPDQRGTALWSEKTYGYDQFGNQVEVTLDGVDRNGNVLTREGSTEYDSLGRYMVKEINAYDQIVSDVLEFNEYGQPLRVRDINGVVSQSRISQFGSPYLQYHPSGAASFEYKAPVDGTYCPEVAVFRSHMISNSGSHKVACYDNIGRDVRMGVRLLDGRWSYVDTEYDSVGRTKRKSEPYTVAAQYWTTYEYDIIGRIVKVTQPGEVGDAVTHNEYNGYTSRVINPLGQIREETKNGIGEVVEIVDSAGVSPSTISNRYDSQGNLIEVITSGSDGLSVAMTMDFDLIGRKVSMDDPDKGHWEYVYNSFDELEEQTDAKGQSTVMYHDLLGRMIERKDFVGAENTALESHSKWVYNNAPTSLGFGLIGNYGRGKMLRSEDLTSGYIQLSSYDHLGRTVETLMQLPGDDTLYYQSTSFDQFGRAHRVFDSAGDITGQDSAIENHYNEFGYLTTVTDAVYSDFSPRHTYYDIQAVDARGNVIKEQQGSWVTTEREYNVATGRLLAINTYSANPLVTNGELQQQSYTWDNIGNLISRSDESGVKNLYEEFTYDHLNRLSTVSLNGAISSEVTYDGLGNIRSKTGVGTYNYLCGDTSGVSGAVASGPHAVCSTGDGGRYYYDANGNMIQDTAVGENGGRNLQYTTFDKPKQITKGGHTTKFEYGPSRARYQRIDISSKGTQTTRYIGNIERVIQSDGSEEVKRYLGNTLIITKINAAGSITAIDLSYILKDHLGSTDVIVGANGGILQEQSFDPWGLRRNATDWAAVSIAVLLAGSNGSSIKNYTTRGFTGHEMLDEVGIIHMNGRIYDPRLGRFLQADPNIDGVDFSQGYNRYSYLHNNPLNGTDPSGYMGLKQYAGLIVGAVLVVATAGGGALASSWFLSSWYGAATLGAITGAVGAAANGGNILQAAAIGALSGAAFHGVGQEFTGTGFWTEGGIGHIAAHGAVGGLTNVLQGGKFGHGFISAGLAKGLSVGAESLGIGEGGQFAAAVLAGGTASQLTGGKFANGATSAALAFAVNRLSGKAVKSKNKPVSTGREGQSSEEGVQEM